MISSTVYVVCIYIYMLDVTLHKIIHSLNHITFFLIQVSKQIINSVATLWLQL